MLQTWLRYCVSLSYWTAYSVYFQVSFHSSSLVADNYLFISEVSGNYVFFFSPKSGVARGCGWQDLGAYANLAAYYLCGIPIAAALGFWLELRGQGLWIGILAGAFLQTVLLSIITSCTNWEKQVYPQLIISLKLI